MAFENQLIKIARNELKLWKEQVNDPFFVASDLQCKKVTNATLNSIRTQITNLYPKYSEEREKIISNCLMQSRQWCDNYWKKKTE